MAGRRLSATFCRSGLALPGPSHQARRMRKCLALPSSGGCIHGTVARLLRLILTEPVLLHCIHKSALCRHTEPMASVRQIASSLYKWAAARRNRCAARRRPRSVLEALRKCKRTGRSSPSSAATVRLRPRAAELGELLESLT